MTLRNRSQLMPARAPFLIAETFDHATPDPFTISFTVNPGLLIPVAAIEDRTDLKCINATSDSFSIPIAFAIADGLLELIFWYSLF